MAGNVGPWRSGVQRELVGPGEGSSWPSAAGAHALCSGMGSPCSGTMILLPAALAF